MKDFYEMIAKRRSVYAIGSDPDVPEQRIEEVVSHALRHSPSSFDSKSARVLLLFGAQHHKLWEIVLDCLRPLTPEERFPTTEKKIAGFAAGRGSLLFFEDEAVIRSYQSDFPLYSENFPTWAQQSNGMLQWIVWTSLAAEGLGASLQHYNPLIDEQVRKIWGLPEDWKLIAQMPFGSVAQEPPPKTGELDPRRLKVAR